MSPFQPDAYSNVFASPGKRTTGTQEGNILITSPKWTGSLPVAAFQIGKEIMNSEYSPDSVCTFISPPYILVIIS
jgi:hypothetical protein